MHSAANLEILRLAQAHRELLPTEKSAEVRWSERLIDALNIKPGMFGMNIDVKKLFGRQK
jgi:predicted DNA binding CopG/RHH family protein